MAFYQAWSEALQATRLALSETVQINDPRNYGKLTGFMNYLFNRSQNPNTINVVQNSNSNASQYRSVEIKYTPHKGTSNVITTDTGNCNKVAQRRDLINTYQPALYVEDKFTIEENWARQVIEKGGKDLLTRRLTEEFQECFRNCRESMDSQLLSKAYGLVGANPAAGVGKDAFFDVEMLKADGTIGAQSFDVIRNQMQDNFMTGTPAIVGLGNARRVFNRFAIGNLNTSGGFDVREIESQFGMLMYLDQLALPIYNDDNQVVCFYPGLTQFYQYNLFKGAFEIQTPDDKIKGTMPDPIYPGLTWDYTLYYDDDCATGNGLQGAWTGRVIAYFDLFTVPEEAFGEPYGDLVDFNGIVGYRITQATS